MNAIDPIHASLPSESFDAAREAVTVWRGRCLDLFARSEAAVTETLLALAADDRLGASIKLPHLVGQRYDALARALRPGGPLADEGRVAAALEAFRQHDDLRTMITHAVFTVTLDRHGHWYLIARLLALRSGRECRRDFVLEEREAAKILSQLEKDCSCLRSTLGQLRKSGSRPKSPP